MGITNRKQKLPLYEKWIIEDVKSIRIQTSNDTRIIKLPSSKKTSYCLIENYIEISDNKARMFIDTVLNNANKASSVKELAALCNYNSKTFQRSFVKYMGVYPSVWFTQRKKETILFLLKNTEHNARKLSEMLGFCTPSAFCNYCKKIIGFSPMQIRNMKDAEETHNPTPTNWKMQEKTVNMNCMRLKK